MAAMPAWALPAGQQVASGSATFTQSGSTLTIKQTSDKLITNWKSFSIGSAETTQFVQPSAKSAALNRVNGGAASLIDGKLLANGKVILINPAGITVGAKGIVNVNSFIASTQDLTDKDFLNGGDDLFAGSSAAAIRNLGTIQASGGDAILIAKRISNEGKISAPSGTVGLAAGTQVLVKPAGEERLFIQPASAKDGTVQQSLTGKIEAATAEVKAAGNPYAVAINLEGLITAAGAKQVTPRIIVQGGNGQIRSSATLTAKSATGAGGRIAINAAAAGKRVLSADDWGSSVEISGILNASGVGAGQAGGDIAIFGNWIRLNQPALLMVSASGNAGTIHVEAAGGQLNVFGSLWANSSNGNAGVINLLGGPDASVILHPTAQVRANQTGLGLSHVGKTGGTIRIGGGFAGSEKGIVNAGKTVILSGSLVEANGGSSGNGGRIAVWSDTDTGFLGNLNARGGAFAGDGGFVEVSSKGNLNYQGLTDTSAPFGQTGTLLIDPSNVIIKSQNNPNPLYDNLLQQLLTGTSVIHVENLVADLLLNNVIIQADSFLPGGFEFFTGSSAVFGDTKYGKIVVVDDIIWDTLDLFSDGGTLTLRARTASCCWVPSPPKAAAG